MESPVSGNPSHFLPFGHLRVLLVDDDDAMRALVREWLEALGCVVAEAASGREALALARNDAFDVLFADVLLPGGLDGFELAVAATNLQPAMKVFFASGEAWGPTQAEEPGTTFLHKPYGKADLAATLHKVMAA